jgi:hypothetical protein
MRTEDVEGIGPVDADVLRGANVQAPENLLEAGRTRLGATGSPGERDRHRHPIETDQARRPEAVQGAGAAGTRARLGRAPGYWIRP